jgi:hypothetical protein
MNRILIVSALAAVCTAAVALPAEASPPGQGCPGGASGFVLWDVTAEPYQVDNRVDESGNGDGLACAKPIYTVTDENGDPFQIYNFLDNQFPTAG